MSPEPFNQEGAQACGGLGVGPAVSRLVLATASWGLSFPVAKALMLFQEQRLPEVGPLSQASLLLMNRMAVAALVMIALIGRRILSVNRREIAQGLELGLFGGVGMLFQTHAQTFIPASTSAFFTQFTCVFVPLAVAWRSKQLPDFRTGLACAMVLLGCAMISGFHGEAQGFGSGEWETIAAAALFTGQILALERPSYAGNDMARVAVVMFLLKAFLFLAFPLPLLWESLQAGQFAGWTDLYGNRVMWGMLCVLGLFSTAYGYATMLQWQPRVSATQAGVIYATEPVFATGWALFLPEWLSGWAGVSYGNEQLGIGFAVGAALVLSANALLIVQNRPSSGGANDPG
jgi:drug/metabolite transporter (DMT)-like permease